MKQLFNFLDPAPHLPEITDKEEVKKRYKYWRLRIFFGMYIGYAFFYFTRKSFTFAMPVMMTTLGFTKTDLGILGSVLYMAYGLSKFVSGVMADRSNPRYFMGVGLILTGLFNICFGLSSSILLFAIFWGLNGWFQGWGWPPCARLLTHWYSQKERGTWWGFWNTSHNIGGALIPLVVAICIKCFDWRIAMYTPGVLCVIVGCVLIYMLRDTPQSLGLPPIEKFRNDYPEQHTDQEKELSAKEILVKYVLKNSYIWLLAFAYFFVYVVRVALNDWTHLYLIESKGFTLGMASFCLIWFEVGGFLGSLSAGWLSDKVFDGKRGPVNVLFTLGVASVIGLLWAVPAGNVLLASSCMFLTGFTVFGPQMLIGMAAAEISHKKAAGTATGFAGWFAYFGAAAAGYPLSKVAQDIGWNGFFGALAVCSVCATLLLIPLWSKKVHPKYAAEKAS